MILVVLTSLGAPLDREIGVISRLAGTSEPDLRIQLSGSLPLPLKGGLDAAAARTMMEALAARGHGCVATDVARVPASRGGLFTVRSFELSDTAFTGTNASGERLGMPFDDLFGLVHATAVVEVEATIEETKRKLSLARMALTGGLMASKAVTTKRSATSTERQPVLYLFRRSGRDHLLIQESGLHYGGLGSRVGRTRHENFNILVAVLRERAPRAFYDQRYLAQRPPRLPVGAADSAVAATDLDVAAYVLAVARLQGQLDETA
jgi:hypothetical protein